MWLIKENKNKKKKGWVIAAPFANKQCFLENAFKAGERW